MAKSYDEWCVEAANRVTQNPGHPKGGWALIRDLFTDDERIAIAASILKTKGHLETVQYAEGHDTRISAAAQRWLAESERIRQDILEDIPV